MDRIPLIVIALAVTQLVSAPGTRSTSDLAASATQFVVDGRPSFLLGISLFDALGPTPPRDEDLDALARWGVGIVRVWAHWHEPIYGRDGALTTRGRIRLASLVARLRERGIILELVLLRPGQLPAQRYPAFSSPKARVAAVKAVTIALQGERGVLFDLYNEHDHRDGPISHAEARVLRDAVKAIDPERLVTISSTSHHLIAPDGHVGPNELRNLREEAGRDAGSVGVDVVAPHLPRTPDWSVATSSRVTAIRTGLRQLGLERPIYLDEESRAEPGHPLRPEEYQRAFEDARNAGAAGWVFHTAAGFQLAQRPFLVALRPDERSALGQLAGAVRGR